MRSEWFCCFVKQHADVACFNRISVLFALYELKTSVCAAQEFHAARPNATHVTQ